MKEYTEERNERARKNFKTRRDWNNFNPCERIKPNKAYSRHSTEWMEELLEDENVDLADIKRLIK